KSPPKRSAGACIAAATCRRSVRTARGRRLPTAIRTTNEPFPVPAAASADGGRGPCCCWRGGHGGRRVPGRGCGLGDGAGGWIPAGGGILPDAGNEGQWLNLRLSAR